MPVNGNPKKNYARIVPESKTIIVGLASEFIMPHVEGHKISSARSSSELGNRSAKLLSGLVW